MHKERFHHLIEKYLKNQISESELQELLEGIEEHEDDFSTSIDQLVDIEDSPVFDQERVYMQLLDNRYEHEGQDRFYKQPTLWWSAAAAILVLIAGAYYTIRYNPIAPVSPGEVVQHNPVELPENTDAILKLADGTAIDFDDSTAFGYNHDGVVLQKLADGSIAMSFDDSYSRTARASEQFHLVSTPKGTSFSLQLPDGSIVFLNSDSKLYIPADFNKSTRNVKLMGEGYFEVAHNQNRPFIVHAKNTAVQVLGTHFNVKSYADQAQVQTTLLEGSVRIDHESDEILLYPGEQAISRHGRGVVKQRVNVQEIIAWKDGYFRFTNASVQEILEDIQRWYAIEGVDYEFRSQERFTGAIKRTRKLTEVLDNIEKISNIKFKIVEGRIIVMK
ncbi:DUF4974 domain-containing protein [Sphingobacterium sp. SGG-5]|uniref:FecR family protein n=1 Tax=Sphingobacterium sp. SGG-5 TaxID=2710881 RepID=UPI0013EE0DFD|nr:FecR domain-containing protein [Sphingobacterium sp. SGG-5]NGM62051.1 DUF4974 domain-containing protein [Sphingobacterium sp. SGG-5]